MAVAERARLREHTARSWAKAFSGVSQVTGLGGGVQTGRLCGSPRASE